MSRFISTHSLPGRNIPEDLHQEHLNRVIKDFIRGLGANKTEDAIMRIGKALGTLFPVIENLMKKIMFITQQEPISLQVLKDRDLIIENTVKNGVFQNSCLGCLNVHSSTTPNRVFLKPPF